MANPRPAFEYDAEKSAANLVKHGIDFVEAQRLWDDLRANELATGYLPEERSLLTAIWLNRYWTAVFTRRGDAIRIISVRRARVKEIGAYDERAQGDIR